MPATRRIAAILVAEVAGYSRLMKANKKGTCAALKAIRRDLGKPKVKEHRGRIVKTTGGFYAAFRSVTDAVRCALEIQREMAERNVAVTVGPIIKFRMGIELESRRGLYIASRLVRNKYVAEPGAVYICEAAFRQVRGGDAAVHFIDLGERDFVFQSGPRRVYRAAERPGLLIQELAHARYRAIVRTTLSREASSVIHLMLQEEPTANRLTTQQRVEVLRLRAEETRLTEEIEKLAEQVREIKSRSEQLRRAEEKQQGNAVAARIGETLPEPQPTLDQVDVSAFAPEGGAAGSELLVQVLLYRLDERAIAVELARAADPDAIPRGAKTLVAKIARERRVDILLEAGDTSIDEPLQSIVWRGEPSAAQFFVTLPETTADRSCNLRVRVFLDEVPIGSLRFALKVSAATPVDQKSVGIRGDAATRYHRAFLSYATPDRPEVLKRAQALRAAHIEFFQDFLSIEPGERWERRLYKEIEQCDLFLLFWSANAARSEWVLREAELAVARQNASPDEEPDITPIILEGPPVPQPIPDSLKHIQFNDYLVYLIAATERERRAIDLPQ